MKKNLKTFMTALKATPLYVGIFEKAEDVFRDFEETVDPKVKICYASYTDEDYSGDAVVFYYKTDTKKYYEAYGSHCSCYGLEGQWDGDEEINFVELENRLLKGSLCDGNVFKDSFEAYKNKVE